MPYKILIVEDEKSILESLTYIFSSESFLVLEAQTVAEARSLLDKEKPDCCILDIGLPDVSGLEFCREIRSYSQIPLLFLSAKSSEIDKVLGLELGADDYVVKPFSPREVLARIKAILRRPRIQTTSPVINPSQSFQVSDEKKQILYLGQDLGLTRYEFKILQLLLSRPGQVYSRDQFMDLLWDSPETSLDRSIDAHIKSIRAKLKKINLKDNSIQTHRGFGYSFKEDPQK